MVEKSTLKLFLTSGVTLTVKADEVIYDEDNVPFGSLVELSAFIEECMKEKITLKFTAEIKHQYKDEKEKVKKQEIKHFYVIPYDKISWHMIEEV